MRSTIDARLDRKIDVPAETVGCSGVAARRLLRGWTGGVCHRLHVALLSELRRADLLNLDDLAVDGSHIRALRTRGSRQLLACRPGPPRLQAPLERRPFRNPLAVTLTSGNRRDVT